MNQHVSILGCGWYGLPLAQELIKKGYQVKGATTTPSKIELLRSEKIQPFLIDLQEQDENIDPEFFLADVLIVCIPPKRAAAEQGSYPSKIQKIIDAASEKPLKVIFISSTSVYSDQGISVDEDSPTTAESASGKAIVLAEKLLSGHKNFQTTIIRFAGLVGPGRNPGRFFAGKSDIPNGQAPINLIHLDDCIQLTLSIIEQDAFGYTFNACSPDHPQKQLFYTKAAVASQLPAPEFIDELSSWKLVLSKNTGLLLNYKYMIDNWSDWLDQHKS